MNQTGEHDETSNDHIYLKLDYLVANGSIRNGHTQKLDAAKSENWWGSKAQQRCLYYVL